MRRFAGDVAVVFRQEWVERLADADGRRSLLLAVVAAVAFFGVAIPLAAGAWWARDPATILVWSWMPMFLVVDAAADTFAGERERNTLETMLVSSLSNLAILGGKLLAVFVQAWLLLLLGLATGILTVSVVVGPPPLVRTVDGLLFVVGITLVLPLFTVVAGIAISIRAPSLRQAQQIISLVLFAAFLVVAILTARLTASADILGVTLAPAGIVALLLALVDGILLVWLMVSFRRSRLLEG